MFRGLMGPGWVLDNTHDVDTGARRARGRDCSVCRSMTDVVRAKLFYFTDAGRWESLLFESGSRR